jgi:hypothetical protein
MKNDTVWREELARVIAPAFAANPHIETVFIFGSVARGWADRYSDIEVGAVWSQSPTEEELQTAASKAGAERWEIAPYNQAKQSRSIMFYVRGARIESAHWTHEAIDNIIADVIERHDVSQNFLMFEKQATVSALQTGVVLHDTGVLDAWRSKVAEYPEGLAVAMVQKHLRFSSFGSREMLAERNEIPLIHENNSHSVRTLLNLLFGLNRIYHPTFKWTKYLVEEMSIAPPNLFARLERVYQADTVSGTQELRSLIEETLDLVEKHLPQIDLASQREEFAKPYESWAQPPEK